MLNVAIYLSIIGTIFAIGLSIFAYKMHNYKKKIRKQKTNSISSLNPEANEVQLQINNE